MSVGTTTLLEIAEGIADRLGAWESGTATGGSTSTLVAAGFPFKDTSSDANSQKYVNDVIYVNDNDNSTIYKERRIVTYAPATGTFTSSNDFGFTVAASDTFDIFKKGFSFTDIKNAINKALEQLEYRATVPLTLITDGDMETSGISNWTISGAGTVSKATSGFAIMRGSQCLRVQNAAVDEHVQSASVACRNNTAYLVLAKVRASSGTAELVAYDVTQSAEIDSETWGEVGEGILYLYFETPSACEQIAVRLQGQEATADCYWDDVVLVRTGAHQITLPSWITSERQIINIYQENINEYADAGVEKVALPWRVIPDMNNPNNLFVVDLGASMQYPVYIEAYKTYSTLSTAASTTTCDKYLAILAGTWHLLDREINKATGQDTLAWKQEMQRVQHQLNHRLNIKTRAVWDRYG